MALALFDRALVVVRGGGDLASGVVYRLTRAGFPVIVTELPAPLLVRRTVSFGDAVYGREITIDGIMARRVESDPAQIRGVLADGSIPVVVDPTGEVIRLMVPRVVVDARMEKVNPGTTKDDAPLVIALGPGYTAGVDCHAVIETNRGHYLGRVITTGTAEPDTGVPGSIQNRAGSRVLRAPTAGVVQPDNITIGASVVAGQVIATVAGQPVIAPFDGVLRGLISEHVRVEAGMKIGDVDPRARREHCFVISDKSLAVGGGVLEAVLAAPQIHAYLAVKAAQ